MDHKKQLLPAWVLIATAAFAFVAIADLPYGYYRLLHFARKDRGRAVSGRQLCGASIRTALIAAA